MINELFLSFVGVFCTASVIAFLGNRLFYRLGFLDRPGKDIIPARKPVSNYQGIFLIVAVWSSILRWFPDLLQSSSILRLLLGGTILGLFALINDVVDRYTDMSGIPAIFRLLIQFILIGLVVYQTQVYLGLDPFGIKIGDGVGFILSVLRIVGFMNAINWFDFNGIACGVSFVGFVTIGALISYVVIPHYHPIGASLSSLSQLSYVAYLLGCVSLTFVIQELKPRGLLRDVGSNFLGFLLAYLALVGGAKVGLLVATLLLVICDAIWVVFRRIFVIKKSPFKGDYTHLHHRLQTLGWTKNEIRGFVWGWTVILMVLMLLQGSNSFNKLIIALLFGGIFFGIHYYLYVIKKIPYEFKA